MAGASAVYGAESVRQTYGYIVPVPAERVLQSADEMILSLAGRPLRFIDSPGHARHHHAIWDERSRRWFTGDSFGISYPELDTPGGRYIFPTTTPVQFDPVALHASIDRMLAAQPHQVCLTHYGALGDVPRLAALLHRQIDAMVDAARSVVHARARHDDLKAALMDIHAREYASLGGSLGRIELQRLLTLDLELNAQGLGVWLDRSSDRS